MFTIKATTDHISLETAKLLKDCGIKSKNFIFINKENENLLTNYQWYILNVRNERISKQYEIINIFTWQEILTIKEFYENEGWFLHHTLCILRMIQEQKYEKADEYFRKACVLIK